MMEVEPQPLPLPGPWHRQGACRGRGPDKFYPALEDGETYPLALCRSCEVREDCLHYALDNRIVDGVWGGLTELERRRLLGIAVKKRTARRPSRIAIPVVFCPGCGRSSGVVFAGSHRMLCLDCRVTWPV
jgi:hypothetical protein